MEGKEIEFNGSGYLLVLLVVDGSSLFTALQIYDGLNFHYA